MASTSILLVLFLLQRWHAVSAECTSVKSHYTDPTCTNFLASHELNNNVPDHECPPYSQVGICRQDNDPMYGYRYSRVSYRVDTQLDDHATYPLPALDVDTNDQFAIFGEFHTETSCRHQTGERVTLSLVSVNKCFRFYVPSRSDSLIFWELAFAKVECLEDGIRIAIHRQDETCSGVPDRVETFQGCVRDSFRNVYLKAVCMDTNTAEYEIHENEMLSFDTNPYLHADDLG